MTSRKKTFESVPLIRNSKTTLICPAAKKESVTRLQRISEKNDCARIVIRKEIASLSIVEDELGPFCI